MANSSGPEVAPSTATGSSQCPKCWRVWVWSAPTDPSYATEDVNGSCPRCGQTVPGLPVSAISLTVGADVSGMPSTL